MIPLPYLRRVSEVTPSQSDLLPMLKAQVEGLWEQQTRFLWIARTDYVQESVTISEVERSVPLDLQAITAISKVEEMGDDDTAWTELTVGTAWRRAGGVIVRVGGCWLRNVRITCTGGYTDATCPADIQYALGVQAKFQLARHGSERVHVSSQNFEGGAGVFLAADLHPSFAAAVKRYGRKAI